MLNSFCASYIFTSASDVATSTLDFVVCFSKNSNIAFVVSSSLTNFPCLPSLMGTPNLKSSKYGGPVHPSGF